MTTPDDRALTSAAAELMGWKEINIVSGTTVWRTPDGGLISSEEWRPLQDKNDAWMLIDKMEADGWDYELGSCLEGHSMFFERGIRDSYTDTREESYEAVASTPQRAIVLAALKVVDG